MALHEINTGGDYTPLTTIRTYEDTVDDSDASWIAEYEDNGYPVREVLIGRRVANGFDKKSQLQMMINIIHKFFDEERENWTDEKWRYNIMEYNFAKTLFNVTRSVRANLDFYHREAPPIDRIRYIYLMNCWQFKPFHRHLGKRRCRRARIHINVIKHYFSTINKEPQEEMRHHMQTSAEGLRVVVY